jgi:hypothetical protein
MTAGLSRYDQDPDALAWARAKVRELESRWRKFADDARFSGDTRNADRWTWLANGVRNDLLGGGATVLGAFDERRASLPPVPDGELT